MADEETLPSGATGENEQEISEQELEQVTGGMAAMNMQFAKAPPKEPNFKVEIEGVTQGA